MAIRLRARLDAPDRRISLLLAVLSLALYLRTMAPGLLPGDPGEFQFAAWRLGLAHPTGYPLYLSLGYLWQHLLALFGVAPATALNSLSALLAAISVGMLYLLLVAWLHADETTHASHTAAGNMVKRAVAALAAAIFAVNVTFWSQSLIAEVYTLHTFFILGLLLLVRPIAAAHAEIAPRVQTAGDDHSTNVLSNRRLVMLALLTGLALAHHATVLLLLPFLLLFIHRQDPTWRHRPIRVWLAIGICVLLPLLFYLYIPLRSGPNASPWYHQSLGDAALSLYTGGWRAFFAFISGRSISAGFYSPDQALAGLPQALWLWWYHFRWPGLLLLGLGVATLLRRKQTDLLVLTLGFLALHQIFNLFYAIGDILVYYIPLYLVGVIWLAYGVHGIAVGVWLPMQQRRQWRPELGLLVVAFLFLLPLRAAPEAAAQLDQSDANRARATWEPILASSPPADAILISNDRNDMPPLFYIQYVEGRSQNLTALFPKIAPDARFADVGATIATALQAGGNRPIFLIKNMPGLEVRFDLEPVPPLVRVLSAVEPHFTYPVDAAMGPLLLLGYTWQPEASQMEIELFWHVNRPLEHDYTTTVQVYGSSEKLAQHDAAPGGRYYPTSYWKPGEVLRERHTLTYPESAANIDSKIDMRADTLLIGMYTGMDLTPLAPFLTIALPRDR